MSLTCLCLTGQDVTLDMKGRICHLTKWQIHPFISKGTERQQKKNHRVLNVKLRNYPNKQFMLPERDMVASCLVKVALYGMLTRNN